MGDTCNIRLYSTKTGETLAYVLSREWGDYENALDSGTAMQNFQLFRHAPELLEHLQMLIAKADDLIAAIDGATDQFENEISALSEAASAGEKVIAKAAGGAP